MKILSGIFALIVLAVSTAFAQNKPVALMPNAFQLCVENTVITAFPLGTVYQFGAGTTFTPTAISTATFPKLPFTAKYTAFPFDPLPGQTKYVYVQETAKAQVFTITGSDGKPQNITVPAAATTTPPVTTPPVTTPPVTTPPVTTPPAPTVVGTYNCVVNFMSDGTFQSSSCIAVTQ